MARCMFLNGQPWQLDSSPGMVEGTEIRSEVAGCMEVEDMAVTLVQGLIMDLDADSDVGTKLGYREYTIA
jgi:hypothetical protein